MSAVMISAMAEPVPDPAVGRRGNREQYPIRGIDVLAIALFWSLIAVVSAASRELDPRFPGLPDRIVSAVVLATYFEYAIWAVLTVPIWWLTSRYAIERGRRLNRILLFVALGVAIAMVVDTVLLQFREGLLAELGRFRRRPMVPRPVAEAASRLGWYRCQFRRDRTSRRSRDQCRGGYRSRVAPR